MTPLSPIPDNHKVMRHYNKAKMRNGGFPSGAAFEMRRKDKLANGQYAASVNWVEYYPLSFDEAIPYIRKDLAKNRDLKASHNLAILDIGAIKEEIKDLCELSFYPYEEAKDSHSYFTGYGLDDDMISDAISLAIKEFVPAIKEETDVPDIKE
ncbi:MAG: hypothetical protein ACTSXQ_07740 [Alphaproteobacteria bacterium]